MSRRLALAFLASLALAGCGGGDGSPAAGTTTAAEPPTVETETTAAAPVDPTASVLLYFMRGEKLGVERREVQRTPAVATAAVTELLDGATVDGLTTAIQDGTVLNGVTIEDAVATVDLSSSFASGGGSLAMTARLAQVVYTATQFPTVESVRIELDGDPVHAFGGEGVDVSKPLTRADFEDVTPQILVEAPAPNDEVTSPLKAGGTSNTFEATHQLELVSGGRVLAKTFVTATSGSGERGTWEAELPFEVDAPTQATLRAFENSAEDGSVTNLVEIPVRLRP